MMGKKNKASAQKAGSGRVFGHTKNTNQYRTQGVVITKIKSTCRTGGDERADQTAQSSHVRGCRRQEKRQVRCIHLNPLSTGTPMPNRSGTVLKQTMQGLCWQHHRLQSRRFRCCVNAIKIDKAGIAMWDPAIILCLKSGIRDVADQRKQLAAVVTDAVLPPILLGGIRKTANTTPQAASLIKSKCLGTPQLTLQLAPHQHQSISHLSRMLSTASLQ